MPKNDLPVIFIFDLDETLIGRTVQPLGYETLMRFIYDGCKHKRLNGVECKIDTNVWTDKMLPNGFIRPHLKESLHQIKKLYPTAEFFIYSLGIKSYVQNIVKYLEKKLEIKFNRPLFTRDDISLKSDYSYLKDINGYFDTIFKSLSYKYPKCKDSKYQQQIMNECRLCEPQAIIIVRNKWLAGCTVEKWIASAC